MRDRDHEHDMPEDHRPTGVTAARQWPEEADTEIAAPVGRTPPCTGLHERGLSTSANGSLRIPGLAPVTRRQGAQPMN
jgi:hypothetical protein